MPKHALSLCRGNPRGRRELVKAGFTVLPLHGRPGALSAPMDIGCAAVMPLASPIGSGRGIANPRRVELIREQVDVPMIVDAGIGTASDAALAMELGADAVLMNTATAGAGAPVQMATACATPSLLDVRRLRRAGCPSGRTPAPPPDEGRVRRGCSVAMIPRVLGISPGDRGCGRTLTWLLQGAVDGGLQALILREPHLKVGLR